MQAWIVVNKGRVATNRSVASVLLVAFCAMVATWSGTAVIAADYSSRAGTVLGTYHPAPSDRSPQTMASVATRFLDSLNATQKRAVQYDVDHSERRRWTNSPVRGRAGGVALGDLDDAQLRAFSDLLASLLGAKGYAKVLDVMLGDDLRAIIDGEPNEGVGIEAFRFAVFGDPSTETRWAVQLDGHHIALNVTLDGDAYSLSPSFIGTYPQVFVVAGEEIRPLGAEIDLAHDLVVSLSPEQRALAVIAEKRGALRIGPGQDGVVPKPVGIPVGLLTDAQRELLFAIASLWFDVMPPAHAQTYKERFLDGIDETRFAWSGPLEAGSDVSWAIQGPSTVIEYANDARGGADDGNPADHVHTVYRDLDRDYGIPQL